MLVLVSGLWLATGRTWDPSSSSESEAGSSPRSSGSPATSNYRVLTRAQTTRLLHFANGFHACLSERGLEIGTPEPLDTRIEFPVPSDANRQRLVRLAVACADGLAGPPSGATLQAVGQGGSAVVLYLPKQCLLDPKVVVE